MSSSDDDDEDFVPEVEEDEQDEDIGSRKIIDDGNTIRNNKRVSTMWDDINASTTVSNKSLAKTENLLRALTSGKEKRTKKRKLRDFKMPILSVDTKKRRADITAAAETKEVTQVVKFAGTEYSVSKKVCAKAAPKLDKVLSLMDEPKKVSTMDKTSMDWDKFKEKEGIEDELKQYTKDGYIEKQDFLQRLDQKRFEIEKAERDQKRRLQQSIGHS